MFAGFYIYFCLSTICTLKQGVSVTVIGEGFPGEYAFLATTTPMRLLDRWTMGLDARIMTEEIVVDLTVFGVGYNCSHALLGVLFVDVNHLFEKITIIH